MINRQSENEPPIVVAVVGPPKVGKSTLIRVLKYLILIGFS